MSTSRRLRQWRVSSAFLVIGLVAGPMSTHGVADCQEPLPAATSARQDSTELAALRRKVDSFPVQLEAVRNAAIAAQDSANRAGRNRAQTALQAAIDSAREQQRTIVTTTNNLVQRFSTGAQSIDVIMTSLNTGIKVTRLASPFASLGFSKKYDQLTKWRGLLPIAGLAAAALYNPKGKSASDVNKTRVLLVGASTSLSGVLDLFRNSEGVSKTAQAALDTLQSAVLLLDFNQETYHDLERIVVAAERVGAADPKLGDEFTAFRQKTELFAGKSRDAMFADPTAAWYVDSALVFFDRAQKRLSLAGQVWDELELVLSAADKRLASASAGGRGIAYLADVRDRINEAREQQKANRAKWEKLRDQSLQLPRATLAQLNSFGQLEVLVASIQKQR